MHNLLTLRGAQVRDARIWAAFIDETIRPTGRTPRSKFQSHHWPMWGNAKIIDYWKTPTRPVQVHARPVGAVDEQRPDRLRDRRGDRAARRNLNNFWPDRGYYGTLKHNSRAVYQRYMGWYDGNPSDLDDLPPSRRRKKYVEYMGGEDAVLEKAKKDFDNGEYRWTAMVLKHVVFANPDNADAKNLLADTYEQMGYQAESGPWRRCTCRAPPNCATAYPNCRRHNTASPDTIKAMPPEMLFDYLAVRLNGQKAAGKNSTLNVNFNDLKKAYGLTVENGVLNYAPSTVAERRTRASPSPRRR